MFRLHHTILRWWWWLRLVVDDQGWMSEWVGGDKIDRKVSKSIIYCHPHPIWLDRNREVVGNRESGPSETRVMIINLTQLLVSNSYCTDLMQLWVQMSSWINCIIVCHFNFKKIIRKNLNYITNKLFIKYKNTPFKKEGLSD